MQFRRPSKIQERAIPLLMANPPVNMIGQSQSGTGKTAAFVLNILSRVELTPDKMNIPQALVLAPTRELARQIVGVVQVMGSKFGDKLKIATAVPMEKRNQKVEASVVVGTPGTTQDLIKRKQFDIRNIRILVLDEADNMLDQQGLGEECIRVKKCDLCRPSTRYILSITLMFIISSFLPKNIQTVLFSATYPDHVGRYANKFAPKANQLTLKHEELTVEGIKQLYLDCDSEEEKFDILVRFYGLLTIGSSIVFVKVRSTLS